MASLDRGLGSGSVFYASARPQHHIKCARHQIDEAATAGGRYSPSADRLAIFLAFIFIAYHES